MFPEAVKGVLRKFGVNVTVKVADAVPYRVVTPTVTVVGEPLSVGVPEMTPVLALRDSPGGSPAAVNVG